MSRVVTSPRTKARQGLPDGPGKSNEIDSSSGRRSTKRTFYRRRRGLAYLIPALILVALLTLVPLSRIAALSLEGGFQNYRDLLASNVFRSTLQITFEVATAVTIICLVAAYPLCYLLTSVPPKLANTLLAVVMLAFWISVVVRAYAWTVILGRTGLINEALQALDLTNQPIPLLYTRGAVLVGMVHYLLPFMILALYGGMVGIDRQLVTAARSLGASDSRAFLSVFLPLSRPAIFAGSVLVFILALGFFVIPALLGGSGEMLLPVYIERQTFYLEWGLASSAAMVLMAISVCLFVIVDRVMGLDKLFASVRR